MISWCVRIKLSLKTWWNKKSHGSAMCWNLLWNSSCLRALISIASDRTFTAVTVYMFILTYAVNFLHCFELCFVCVLHVAVPINPQFSKATTQHFTPRIYKFQESNVRGAMSATSCCELGSYQSKGVVNTYISIDTERLQNAYGWSHHDFWLIIFHEEVIHT